MDQLYYVPGGVIINATRKETCSLTISIGFALWQSLSGECYHLRYPLITTILPPRLN